MAKALTCTVIVCDLKTGEERLFDDMTPQEQLEIKRRISWQLMKSEAKSLGVEIKPLAKSKRVI